MSAPTTGPRRCPNCGADSARPDARFCEHCGTALSTAASGAPLPEPLGDIPARFRALQGHADFAALLGATPEVPELAGKTLPSVLLLALLAVVGLAAALPLLWFCAPLGFALFALVLFLVYSVLKNLFSGARAPLLAHPALVVDLRRKLMAGAEHSPAHARHFVTLEFPDGRRTEHECYGSTAGSMQPGDLGIAYLKGERVAFFTRVAL